LLLLAAVSLATGDVEAAIIILVMVVLSVSLGSFQERCSHQAAEELRAMVQPAADRLRFRITRTPMPLYSAPTGEYNPTLGRSRSPARRLDLLQVA